MGSGVAKAIRAKWPTVYRDYRHAYNYYEKTNLQKFMGTVIISIPEQDRVVYNCITQFNYGRDGAKYVSYDAIDHCMVGIANSLYTTGPISMPKIGAGLGGGEWSIIESIIKYRLPNHQITIWELPNGK